MLLSAPDNQTIKNLILEYVSTGKEGPQAILDLRKVCSTTKNVVDSLESSVSRRVHSNLHITIRLRYYGSQPIRTFEEAAERFYIYPPPPGVVSLELDLWKISFNEEVRTKYPTLFYFWKTRMEMLKSDSNVALFEILGKPQALKSLTCRITDGTHFPPLLFEVETLHVYQLDKVEINFYKQVASNNSLKKISTTLSNPPGILEGLQVILQLKNTTSFLLELEGFSNLYRFDKKDLQEFISVAAFSNSVIRISRLNEQDMEHIYQIAKDSETAKRFLKCFIGLEIPSGKAGTMRLLRQNEFPSLDFIKLDLSPDYDQRDLIEMQNCLPRTLTVLHSYKMLNPTAYIPATLTMLAMWDIHQPTPIER